MALDDHATRSDIDKQLEWLAANVQPGGRIYFYFSGHGAPDASAGTPYLLPYDGDPKFLQKTALPLASVLKELGRPRRATCWRSWTAVFRERADDPCFRRERGRWFA